MKLGGFRFAKTLGNNFCNAITTHSDSIEGISNLHGAFLVGNDDEL
jgi:hypothetical protein